VAVEIQVLVIAALVHANEGKSIRLFSRSSGRFLAPSSPANIFSAHSGPLSKASRTLLTIFSTPPGATAAALSRGICPAQGGSHFQQSDELVVNGHREELEATTAAWGVPRPVLNVQFLLTLRGTLGRGKAPGQRRIGPGMGRGDELRDADVRSGPTPDVRHRHLLRLEAFAQDRVPGVPDRLGEPGILGRRARVFEKISKTMTAARFS